MAASVELRCCVANEQTCAPRAKREGKRWCSTRIAKHMFWHFFRNNNHEPGYGFIFETGYICNLHLSSIKHLFEVLVYSYEYVIESNQCMRTTTTVQ